MRAARDGLPQAARRMRAPAGRSIKCRRHPGACGWRSCGGRHRHTAHQLGPARVEYRFHPLYGREVQVIRNLRTREEPGVIVQGEEDLRLLIPCWMLDESCCRGVAVQNQPRIALEALVGLRALIDEQSMLTGGGDAESDLIMANGERHESTTEHTRADTTSTPREA